MKKNKLQATEEQCIARDKTIEWFQKARLYKDEFPYLKDSPFLIIGGFAGTGKTYLISLIVDGIKDRKLRPFAFCTFTGKASSVLNKRLDDEDVIGTYDYVGTIHSLIYKPLFIYDRETRKNINCGWEKVPVIYYDLIIIDEASMITEEIWRDLLGYKIPIIVVGDHGQLPPIGDRFNLMANPHITLTKIHRQAEENPIIRLSKDVREGKRIPHGVFSKEVFKLPWQNKKCKDLYNSIQFDEETILLCGMNKTRVSINNDVRKRLKYDLPEPYPDERVICLKNNKNAMIMNGQLGTPIYIRKQTKDLFFMDIQIDGRDEIHTCLVHRHCFGLEDYSTFWENFRSKDFAKICKKTKVPAIDIFDFGYAISVHKSQGSEWERVVLWEERSYYWDDDFYKRWLYTAITRAKNKLFIISQK